MRKKYKILFIFVFSCLISSCNKDKNTQIVQQNIKQYIEENLDLSKVKISKYKFSNLYILTPLETDKLPNDTTSSDGSFESVYNKFDKASGILNLSISGCTRSSIEDIVENDKLYRKWKTGAKEYLMVSFLTLKNQQGPESSEVGLAFRFSKELNITKVYNVKEEDDDYVYSKIFGYTEGKYYGAVNSEYDYLERMYNYYVEFIKNSENNTETHKEIKYSYVKSLNDELFGYEHFKITDDIESTINNCIENINELEDLKILKDKAYSKIKSFKKT